MSHYRMTLPYDERSYHWSEEQRSQLVPKMVADERVEVKIEDSDMLTYTTLEPATEKGSLHQSGATKKNILGADDGDFSSWERVYPKNWRSKEVVEWYYNMATQFDWEIQSRRGDKFNTLTGVELTHMSRDDFEELDPDYGSTLYTLFQRLVCAPDTVDCSEPMAMESTFSYDRDYSDCYSSFLPSAMCKDVPVGEWSKNTDDCDKELKVTGSLLIAGFDYDFDKNDQMFEYIPDEGYHSSSSPRSVCSSQSEAFPSHWSDSSGDESSMQDSPWWSQNPSNPQRKSVVVSTFENRFADPTSAQNNVGVDGPQRPTTVDGTQRLATVVQSAPSTPSTSTQKAGKRPPGRPRKYPLQDRPKGTRGRKPGQKTKGNHLWEFVRELLLDPNSNPRLVKWLNHNEGIFCFVQSDTVAKMWGEKKKNSNMTYEKMSRAMRYCRGNDDFAEIPKDGTYPKKLCFKFGPNATGWEKKPESRPPISSRMPPLVMNIPVTSIPTPLPSMASMSTIRPQTYHQPSSWSHVPEEPHHQYSQYTVPHADL